MTEQPETDLSVKMRALADSGHERAAELRERADAFDASNAADPFDPRKMLGCWARARRVWSECSGEPLV